MKPYISLVLGVILFSGCGLKLANQAGPEDSVTWKMDVVKNIGGLPTLQVGNPQVIETPGGMAVLFDGREDGLQVNTNPLEWAEAFTIELVFRPDPEGNIEQPWFHIQELPGNGSVLLESHTVDDRWFLSSYVQSEASSQTLEAEDFRHSYGKWFHVALVYDGKQIRQYVNGQEELSAPLTITPLERGRTSLGTHMDLAGFFKGAILVARFTPRALDKKDFMKPF